MCAAADLSDCRLVCSITPAGVDVKGGGKAAVHRSAAHSGAQTLDLRPAVLFGHASGKVDRQLCVDHAPVLPPSRPLFVMSIIARYSIFSRLSSVGNTDLALVTLRSWRLKPSMALVV